MELHIIIAHRIWLDRIQTIDTGSLSTDPWQQLDLQKMAKQNLICHQRAFKYL